MFDDSDPKSKFWNLWIATVKTSLINQKVCFSDLRVVETAPFREIEPVWRFTAMWSHIFLDQTAPQRYSTVRKCEHGGFRMIFMQNICSPAPSVPTRTTNPILYSFDSWDNYLPESLVDFCLV